MKIKIKYINLLKISLLLTLILPFLLTEQISFLIVFMMNIIILVSSKKEISRREIIEIFFIGIILIITQIFNNKIKIHSIIVILLGIWNFKIILPKSSLKIDSLISVFSVIKKTMIVACIYNLLINYSVFQTLLENKDYTLVRLQSYFAHRNVFGFYLFIGIAYVLNEIEKNKKKRKNEIILLLFIANIFLTFSRNAIISLVIFFIFYKIIFNKKNRLKIILFIFSLIIILLLIYVNTSIGKETYYFINNSLLRLNHGTSGRGELWDEGIKKILINPIIGYGINSAHYLNSQKLNFHNTLINTWIENGIIFTIYIYVCIFKMTLYSLKNYSYNSDYKFISSLAMAFLFYINFETVLLFSPGYLAIVYTYLLLIILKINKELKYRGIKL